MKVHGIAGQNIKYTKSFLRVCLCVCLASASGVASHGVNGVCSPYPSCTNTRRCCRHNTSTEGERWRYNEWVQPTPLNGSYSTNRGGKVEV